MRINPNSISSPSSPKRHNPQVVGKPPVNRFNKPRSMAVPDIKPTIVPNKPLSGAPTPKTPVTGIVPGVLHGGRAVWK